MLLVNQSIAQASIVFVINSALILSLAAVQNIGEDLFAIALDQPFRFPATFTFVLRAFSTLEGLGKV